MPGILGTLAERRIEAAIAAGEFDRLPGAGLPLRLEDDALVPQEWRLAFLVLRRSGLASDWIEARRGGRGERALLLSPDRRRPRHRRRPSGRIERAAALTRRRAGPFGRG